ncbi:MAG TPA: aminotransferase class I/II-fold pyridoxal phosphate-dependent enzyme, partial [Rhodospirillales bacterium]|nr:aminotransferase class I/II-fold pyridoxal phosphate-dependent enzyme [Rhodospirillales bacterium]
MEKEFHKIGLLPPYVFAEVNAMKARARAAGADIIDFGMGNPDQPTPPHIVEKLVETVQDPKTHRYSTSRGIPGLRKAIAAYYGRRFGVDVDPETETIVTLGSKEGLANLSSAITNDGDVILAPNPSYPIHPFGFIIAGAGVRSIPIGPEKELMKALRDAVENSSLKPKAVVLNYPNNPTAKVVDLDFYEQVVDYCLHHGIYILSDIAYAEVYFDGPPPPSILQVKRAWDIAVEFSSMSKTYSMPGWRIGFATGNKKLISAL